MQQVHSQPIAPHSLGNKKIEPTIAMGGYTELN